jgi:putative membrane protein
MKGFLKMKKSLTIALLSFGLAVGCNSNKAATPDNANSAQPPASQPSPSDNSNTSSSASSSTASNSSTNPDQQFISDAAKGNRAEVQLGKMVASKTSDPSVKRFAQMMVDDHTKALNQLQQVASAKNITLPDGVPDDAKDLQDKLTNESGKQLDKDYMDGMVQDHQKDVQEFQEASQNLHDPAVKQWATKTLPTLQLHLQRAQQVDAKLNGGSADNTKSQ